MEDPLPWKFLCDVYVGTDHVNNPKVLILQAHDGTRISVGDHHIEKLEDEIRKYKHLKSKNKS